MLPAMMAQAMAGRLAAPAPERPGRSRPAANSVDRDGVVVGVTDGGGAAMAGPMSRAMTIRRDSALYFGWQVVIVSRLSGVSSRTEMVSGVTTFFSNTW